MREAFRPYTKVVTVSDANKVTIPLTDSANVLVEANYVQVEALSGGANVDFFVVSPSGLGLAEADADFQAASAITSHASGTAGLAAPGDTGSVILSLPPRDTVSSIILSQNSTGPVIYAINYGVVNVVNSLADGQKTAGN